MGFAMNSLIGNTDTKILSLLTNSQGRGISSLYAKAVGLVGMWAVVGDMAANSTEIIEQILREGCNVCFGDMATIYRIAKENEGRLDLKSLGLKLICVTMGHVSAPAKSYLQRVFGCPVKAHYGLTELGWGFALECDVCEGYHANELDVFTEIIDPNTGLPVPDGAEGELTFTLLHREAMPLIRYRSGDIATKKASACEQHLETIGPIIRRIEGTITLPSGDLLYPAMLEEILQTVENIIDYKAFVQENRLTLYIEVLKEATQTRAEVRKKLCAHPVLKEMKIPEILPLEKGALKKFCHEKKTIATSLKSF